MDYLHLLIDAVIVLILLLFFLQGRKKGLVLTLCGLAAVFVAFFGARMAAEAFTPRVTEAIQPHIHAALSDKIDTNVNEYLESLLSGEQEGALTEVLKALGLHDRLTDSVRSALEENAAGHVTDAVTALAAAIAEVVAGVLIFIAAFLILLLVWALVSRLLDLAAKIPGINFLNRTLGGLAGLLKGALLLFLAIWVLRMFDGLIPDPVMERSVLLQFFCTFNPLSLISGI